MLRPRYTSMRAEMAARPTKQGLTNESPYHPLAVSVNRDEHISATRPRILSLQSLSSQPRAHRTLGSRTLVAPKRTSHPSGSRPARLAARGPWLHLQPQKTLCSPPCPILAAGLASRTGLWLHRVGDPTPCGSRYGRNELMRLGGIGAGVQSALMVLPTFPATLPRPSH